MFLSNICSKKQESMQCVCNSSTESDRQEPPWNSNLICSSLSYDSVYYEEKDFNNEVCEVETKPYHNAHQNCNTPAVEIHDESTTSIDLPPISWHGYNCTPKFLTINNADRNILINGQWPSGKPYIKGGPLNGNYMFSQIHFHCPSEHEINGKRYPLEMHAVHYKTSYLTQERAMEEKDGTVVLVYLFQVKDVGSTVLSWFTKECPHKERVNTQSEIPGIALNYLMTPFYSNYYIYWGSLSTQKSSYLLQWIINCSSLCVTRQEVHDLFKLMESGELYDGRRAHVMKPVNNAVYYVGGFCAPPVNSQEANTHCNNCHSHQVSAMTQSCQAIRPNEVYKGKLSSFFHTRCHALKEKKKKKKDVQLQASSSENCSVKSSQYIIYCKKKGGATESNEKATVTDSLPSSLTCVLKEEKKIKKEKQNCEVQEAPDCSAVKFIPVDIGCEKLEDKNCVLVKVTSKPVVKNCETENQGKLKKKQKTDVEKTKFKSGPKTPNKQKEKKKKIGNTETVSKLCEKDEKKKKKWKSTNTENSDTVKECKSKEVTSEEQHKDSAKACKNDTVRTKDSDESIDFKFTISDCQENKTVCEKKPSCNKFESAPTDYTVNFLLTPSSLQTIPSRSLLTSESEGIKKVINVTDTKNCSFELPNLTKNKDDSDYQLPQVKAKKPLTEFFLQTEHLFHAEKKGDFSVCISQDYNVAIIYNQNILQEFKGSFSPNKLELGSYEKLDLIPKYPEPDNIMVRLEDCIVKMESPDQLYIRAKFLLKKFDFNIIQGVENEIFEETATESQRLIDPEIQVMFAGIQQDVTVNNKECYQSNEPSRLENQLSFSPNDNGKQEQSHVESVSKDEIKKKQECMNKLQKKPFDAVETSEDTSSDYTYQPCETKTENESHQKTLTRKSDKTLKSLFYKRKKTVYFPFENLERDESSEKEVLEGNIKTKNESKSVSMEKKSSKQNGHYLEFEETIENKQENYLPVTDKKLVFKTVLSDEFSTEQIETQSFSETNDKFSEKKDKKDIVVLHKYNPDHFKPQCFRSERKSTSSQGQVLCTSDVPLAQDVKLEKSKIGSLMVKIRKSPTVNNSQIAHIMVPLDLNSQQSKKTNIEVILIQDSKSSHNKCTKKEKEFIPCLNCYE